MRATLQASSGQTETNCQPPLTESMEPELLEWVQDTLFPRDSGQAQAVEDDPSEGELPAPVTPGDEPGHKKTSAKNTAPGPD